MLAAAFFDGELSFFIDGVPVIERVFVTDADGEFIVAQWKVLATIFSITEKTDGQRLANASAEAGGWKTRQLLSKLFGSKPNCRWSKTTNIVAKENEMNKIIDELYGLRKRM